jgi:tetratricopeptide (TPR) repeat protein
MRRKASWAIWCGFLLFLGGFDAGCSRDPNVRKLKFLEQGNRDFEKGKYPEANISYSRALQIDPRFVDAHYKLAECLLKQGSWAAAFQELSRTVDLQPDNWPAQLDLGRLLLAGSKYQDAKDRALLILRSNPKHTDAQILLSDADASLGNTKEALQEAKDATEMEPQNSVAFLNFGLLQAQAGAMDGAEKALQKAQALDSASVTPLLALGNFYQLRKLWPQAEKEFQAAVALDPKSTKPRAALAGLYMAQGQDSLVEKVLTDAKLQLKDEPSAYRMLGDYYLARGENDKALAEFSALSTEHPNDLGVQKTLTQLLISNHRIDEADKLDDRILKKGAQDADALILKGQIQLQQKKVGESIQSLQQAVKYAPENAMGYYYLGLALQQKGDLQQAESEWREAVKLRSNLPEAWRALGTSAAQRRDWRALESIADQLKLIAPRSPEGYLFHATARINQGDAAGTEADLKYLIDLAPESALGYVKLGQLRTAQKRWEEAAKAYREGLAREPNSLEALQGLVELNFRRDRAPDAVRLVQDKISQNPDNAALYLLLAQAQVRSRQPEEAEKALTRAIQLDKQNVNAMVMMADLQSKRGDTSEAIINYGKAIELAPNNARLYVAQASLYEGQGNWQQAQALYEKALAIQPDDALAANNLAYLMLEHAGSVNVALNLAQTARRGLPTVPNSADTLGWAYYHNGAYSVAAPLFEEAVKKVPSNATYHFHLGLTYQKLNDNGRARSELERSMSLAPKSPIADKAREAIGQITDK